MDTCRASNRMTLGLGSAVVKSSWKELYSRFNADFRELPDDERAVYARKAELARQEHKRRVAEWTAHFGETKAGKQLEDARGELRRLRRELRAAKKSAQIVDKDN